MTSALGTTSAGTPVPTMTERAWRARRRAYEMLPMLNAFAKALTKNQKVRVEIREGVPCTDGTVIYMRPPMELGDPQRHERRLCGQRDERTSNQLCEGCYRHEKVLSTMLHEIAHIAFESFSAMSDADKAQIVDKMVHETPSLAGKRIDKIKKAIDAMDRRDRLSHIAVCNLISQYLGPIHNALEDARVNTSMIAARPGARPMFRAKVIDVFENGIEQSDGSIAKWNEAPRDTQVIVGLYVKASGFDYKGWFSPDVEAALDDPGLGLELMSVANSRSPAAVYRIGFPVLEHLRRLGFCKRSEDIEDDPPPKGDESEKDDGTADDPDNEDDEGNGDGEPQESDDGDDDGDTGAGASDSDDDDYDEEEIASTDGDDTDDGNSAGKGDDDDDWDDDDEDWGDDESSGGDEGDDADIEDDGNDDGDSGSPSDQDAPRGEDPADVERALKTMGGHADDDKPETWEEQRENEELDKAIRQGEDFDEPSSGCIEVHRHYWDKPSPRRFADRDDGWFASRRGTITPKSEMGDFMPPEGMVATLLLKARIAFAANKRGAREPNHRSGRINGPRLATVATGNDKVFSRSNRPKRRDYHVVVSLDMSGSTGSTTYGALAMISRLGMACGELFDRLGVGFEMYGHSGYFAQSYSKGRSYGRYGDPFDLDIFVIKERNDGWTDKCRSAIRWMNRVGANLDGHAMEFMRKRLDESNATDKIMLYVTDGSMPAENYGEELPLLQREIAIAKRKGYQVLGVGVQCDDPIKHGLETVRVDKIEDIKLVIDNLARKLAR